MLPALRRTFRAFGSRDYRLLWAGAFTSSVGTWMQKVAQSWLVLTVSGSAFWLGVDGFLADVPFLLLTLVGGVLADRLDRRRILLASQTVQMSAAFLLAGLVATETVRLWMILSLSFVVGLAQSLGMPAYQALVPTLVRKEELPNAIALNSIQFNLARVVGPVLAGLAFYRLGAAACFSLNGLSFLAVIAALLLLTGGGGAASGGGEPVLSSLRAGLLAVRRGRGLAGLVALAFVGSFASIPLVTFLPVFARDVFGQDAGGYSRLLAAFGAGAVAGGIGVAGLGATRRRGRIALGAYCAFGCATSAFALSRVPLLSYLLLVVAGASLMTVFSLFMTLVQSNVTDDLRGRVTSVYALAFRGGMPLGSLAAGSLSTVVGAPRVLLGSGLLLAVTGAAALLLRRERGVATLD